MRDFNHTVSFLVQKYFSNELIHGICTHCVVGSMVHEATGFSQDNSKVYINPEEQNADIWGVVFLTQSKGYQKIRPTNYISFPLVKQAIDATGYTWQELAKIEYAFEIAEKGNSEDDHMFNGLMAVVDVLADIHGIDLKVKEEAKLLFVKA